MNYKNLSQAELTDEVKKLIKKAESKSKKSCKDLEKEIVKVLEYPAKDLVVDTESEIWFEKKEFMVRLKDKDGNRLRIDGN